MFFLNGKKKAFETKKTSGEKRGRVVASDFLVSKGKSGVSLCVFTCSPLLLVEIISPGISI